MTRAPTRATAAGRSYLALQRFAREQGRATDELLQLFALEAFLDRLSGSASSQDYVLKGGVLLAAYALRRPTRDIDISIRRVRNEAATVLEQVQAILAVPRDDGWQYGRTSADTIREDDVYSGLRITIASQLASARVSFHVDLNFGDPIWPGATRVEVPRLLGGSITVDGYPLAMIHAEKIVTCVQRGVANTRWRDFADIYLLSRIHPIASTDLSKAISVVASFRKVRMGPLRDVLEGFADLAQKRWAAWVRRQALSGRLPADFSLVQSAVEEFADPAILAAGPMMLWAPETKAWRIPGPADRVHDASPAHHDRDSDVDLDR